MKRIIICEQCEEESFAEGDCPNEIMQSSGYIQDEENLSNWFCSQECKEEFKK